MLLQSVRLDLQIVIVAVIIALPLPGHQVVSSARETTPSAPIVPNAGDPRPIASLGRECIAFANVKRGTDAFDIGDCRPSRVGTLGVIDGRTYYAVFYCVLPRMQSDRFSCEASPFGDRAVAVFASNPGSQTASLLLERSDSSLPSENFTSADFVRNSFGTFLSLGISGDGTSQPNFDEFFLWNESKHWWQPIEFDIARIFPVIDKKQPRGLEYTGCGPWMDLAGMTVDFGLQGPSDAHCYESATARIRLTIKENRFEVASYLFLREPAR